MTCTYVESPLGAQATVTSSGRWLPFKVRIIQSYADWGALCYLPSLHNTPYLGLVLHIALLQSFFLMGNRWFILWTPTVTVLQLTHSGRQEGRVCSHVKIDTPSVQFSSVAQSCLCDSMNCSTPGLPVHHQLPEFTQTHVHRVGDDTPYSLLIQVISGTCMMFGCNYIGISYVLT